MKQRKIHLKLVAWCMIICVCFGFTSFKVSQNMEVKNYLHSENCQIENWLQLDCFDSCNGYQVNSASQQQHNVPNESNILIAFDALTIDAFRLVYSSFLICAVYITSTYQCNSPFLRVLFKPPVLG